MVSGKTHLAVGAAVGLAVEVVDQKKQRQSQPRCWLSVGRYV